MTSGGPDSEDAQSNQRQERLSAESAGRGRPGASSQKYEINTSYRDTYGGNPGTNMDSWRSASSSPVKQSRSLEHVERPSVVTEELETRSETLYGDKVASKKYNPLEDIAVLTTGQVLRHRDAMESLVGALRACSLDREHDRDEDPSLGIDRRDDAAGVGTSSLIATNGGTHLMTVNLIESSDREMRDVCAEGLIEMFRREPSALVEVGSSRETVSKLLGVSVREMLGGRGAKASSSSSPASSTPSSSKYRELFKLLVESPSDHVPKSCAEHKIVHKLVERLRSRGGSPGTSAAVEEDRMMILSTLQTMIDTGNEYYISSFVWNGALDVVLPMLAAGGDRKNDQRTAMAKLVASVCVGRDDGRSIVEAWVCTSEAVKGLSLMLADDDIEIDVQVLAARVLLEVSYVRSKKEEVLDAMVDYCLPRACEIIIDGDDDDQLVAIVAAIAANLAQDSKVAMEVLIFHANVLRRVVGVLVGGKSYGMGGALLSSACVFASLGDIPFASRGDTIHS